MSFLVKEGNVFYSIGYNQYNIDGKIKSLHAEVDAINHLKYSEKTTKVIIVVYRINNAGTKFLMSKPCSCCMNYMRSQLKYKNYKLHRGYYSDNDGNFQKFIL